MKIHNLFGENGLSTLGITALLILRYLINGLVCDLDVELGNNFSVKYKILGLFDFYILHDLSSDRREPGWFLSIDYSLVISTKGLLLIILIFVIKLYIQWCCV